MSDSASNTEDSIQIEIFPSRILSPETAQNLIAEIYKVDGVIRVMVQGNRLPDKVSAGPGTGEKVEHPLRKPIQRTRVAPINMIWKSSPPLFPKSGFITVWQMKREIISIPGAWTAC